MLGVDDNNEPRSDQEPMKRNSHPALIPDEWNVKWEDISTEQENVLGTGGFTHVYEGSLHGKKVAVKRFEFQDTLFGDQLDTFQAEVNSLCAISQAGGHNHIIRWYGACQGKGRNAIVLEYAGCGSFYDYMVVHGTSLLWTRVINLYIQVASALSFLHGTLKPALIHRDVKCANVLLVSDSEARLADFGLAKFKTSSHRAPTRSLSLLTVSTPCGTRQHMSPELVAEMDYDERVDVYAFGISLLEGLVRADFCSMGLVPKENIMTKEYGIFQRPLLPRNTPPALGNIFRACTSIDPEKRPTAAQVLQELQEVSKSFDASQHVEEADYDGIM